MSKLYIVLAICCLVVLSCLWAAKKNDKRENDLSLEFILPFFICSLIVNVILFIWMLFH